MKIKLPDLKDPRFKRGVVISLPIIFALTAAVAIALLVKPAPTPNEPTPPAPETEKKDVPVVAPPETDETEPQNGSLEFLDLGNGSCAVTGIGSYSGSLLVIPKNDPDGNIVTAISDRAFENCRQLTGISIPYTVMEIGSRAFFGCSSLEYIEVNDANPLFLTENGVLFNREMTKLIFYPAGKSDRVYALPKSVTAIGENAFSSCPNLQEIDFWGNKSQWNNIRIASGNTGLNNVTVTLSANDK